MVIFIFKNRVGQDRLIPRLFFPVAGQKEKREGKNPPQGKINLELNGLVLP